MALVTCGMIREGRKRSSKFAWKAPVGRWRGAETQALRVCRLLSLPSPREQSTWFLFLTLGITAGWESATSPGCHALHCPSARSWAVWKLWGEPCHSWDSSPGNSGTLGTGLLGPGRHLSQSPAITLSVWSYWWRILVPLGSLMGDLLRFGWVFVGTGGRSEWRLHWESKDMSFLFAVIALSLIWGESWWL